MKKLSSIFRILLVTLVAFSYGCSREDTVSNNIRSAGNGAAGNDNVDRAWQGSMNRRTWVITSISEPPPANFHFEVGDAFRIEKRGANPEFAPLSTLRKRWGVEEGMRIQLEKTRGANPRFCAEFSRHTNDNEEVHYLIIDPPGHGPNKDNEMEVAIMEWNETPCQTIEIPNHGGRAHAEN